jgi:hypothetical protein
MASCLLYSIIPTKEADVRLRDAKFVRREAGRWWSPFHVHPIHATIILTSNMSTHPTPSDPMSALHALRTLNSARRKSYDRSHTGMLTPLESGHSRKRKSITHPRRLASDAVYQAAYTCIQAKLAFGTTVNSKSRSRASSSSSNGAKLGFNRVNELYCWWLSV